MSRNIAPLRGPPRFTEREDQILISAIGRTPSIYDTEHRNFKNQEIKGAQWLWISEMVKRDVDLCKKRWKDIRNNYFKIKKQQKVERCNWSLYEHLGFLDRVYENCVNAGRRMVSPTNEEDLEEQPSCSQATRESVPTSSEAFLQDPDSRSGMDLQPSTSAEPSIRKRRFEEVSSDDEASKDTYNPPPGRDEVDLFMKSIALQMKKMPPRKIAQAKVRILTIVNELQFGQLRMGDT